MSLANPELALEKAQEFLALLQDGWDEHRQRYEGDATAKMRGMLPLMRDIAARVQPNLVSDLQEAEPDVDEYLRPVWRWVGVKERQPRRSSVFSRITASASRFSARLDLLSQPRVCTRGSGTRPLTFGMTGTTSTLSMERQRRWRSRHN